jgi:hypothetical protein
MHGKGRKAGKTIGHSVSFLDGLIPGAAIWPLRREEHMWRDLMA